jgi:2-aminoethylphosphonate-pyruvate transaminase
MTHYKLLTPGPLTTSEGVRKEMLVDRCTWDDDYKAITQKIRSDLLKIAGVNDDLYTVILLQGSGSFGVEATLNTSIGEEDTCLFIVNGAYGQRMVQMAEKMKMGHYVYACSYNQVASGDEIRAILDENKEISHIAMVHCETTTGMLNPLEEIAEICRSENKVFILDAMSSFGGIYLDIETLGIDYLISSANKCIQGVPGFSFVIVKKDVLKTCEGNAKSLVMDLYDQWTHMDIDGKWRYTSPTHVVAAFSKALDELEKEGGVKERQRRYFSNNQVLIQGMKELGFMPYVAAARQSPIITTFLYPNEGFDFSDFYRYVKSNGYILYPGKLTDENTFRIGNIGEIYPKDMESLVSIVKTYMEEKHV